MQINWFEVFAQILNFFILLALLNKFLFKPVMAAMEKREEEIANTVLNAETKFVNGEKLVNEYELKISEIKNKEEEIINTARKEAEDKRDILLTQYKEEMKLRKENFENEFKNEQTDFIKAFRDFLANYTVKISKKLLLSLSKTELEDKVFEGLLKTLSNVEEDILIEERKNHKGILQIQSTNKIEDSQKEEIVNKLGTILKRDNNDLNIEFQINPDLIYGFKVIFNTFTVNENLDFYLQDLEEEVSKQQKF